MTGESQSLYRKYRPRSFAETELVGQEAVARTLRNAIQAGRVAHAYLFCGPRGTGKTSTARLLARAVNCEATDATQRPCNECAACLTIGLGENRSLDIIEIDAASNRGIDDIRELREKINFAPSQLRYKFYIIDEVHQLSEAASNALLKTLEEPPRHAKFVLATTDPQKVLETILSRCQVFRFRRIPLDRMVAHLRRIGAAEAIEADDEALAVIARQATGSLRDALGLLDKLIAYADERITVTTVQAALGIHGDERAVALIDAALAGDIATELTVVNAVIDEGVEPRQFTQQLVDYLRELLLRLAGGASPMIGLSPLREAAQARQLEQTSLPVVADLVQRLSAIDYALERGAYGALPLELALVEANLARTASTASPAPPAESSARPSPGASRPASEAPPRPLRPVAPARPRPAASEPPAATSEPSPTVAGPPVEVPASDAAEQPTTVAPAGEVLVPVTSLPAPDQLRSLWAAVMRQINARHRRVHALLREAEPLLIEGDELVLMVAYPFHLNMITQDDNRQMIEQVIERQAGRLYRLTCVLASEADAYRARASTAVDASPAPTPSSPVSVTPVADEPASPPATPPSSTPPASSRPAPRASAERTADEARLQAAMNIFNAHRT